MSYHSRFYPAKKYRWTVIPLKMIKEMLLKRRENDRDNIIIITGQRGEGKSTLAGKILFQFEDFKPFEQIVYSKESLLKQIKNKDSLILCDEAVISASKGNVMTRASKMLHEILTINRSNRNILFMLIPNIEDFDSKILQYCSMWLFVDTRGYAVMFLPENKGIFGKKNWNLDQMKKLYEEFTKENQKNNKMPYWCYNSFRGSIRFGKLTKDQQEAMDEVKRVKKNENIDKEMQEQTIFQAKDVDQYAKYSAMKLAKLIVDNQIRSQEAFELTCKEYKLLPEQMMTKIDNILKNNNVGKTSKQIFKECQKQDQKLF